ncbi:hypothetical protein ABTQ00_19660, partial [Acinetobacter baumannii]
HRLPARDQQLHPDQLDLSSHVLSHCDRDHHLHRRHHNGCDHDHYDHRFYEDLKSVVDVKGGCK